MKSTKFHIFLECYWNVPITIDQVNVAALWQSILCLDSHFHGLNKWRTQVLLGFSEKK